MIKEGAIKPKGNAQDKNIENIEAIASNASNDLNPLIDLMLRVLKGDDYEDANSALLEVKGLHDFREGLSNKQFAHLHNLVEVVTLTKRFSKNKEELEEQLRYIVDNFRASLHKHTPRITDLYKYLLARIENKPYKPEFEIVAKKIEDLEQNRDVEVLFSGQTSWDIKRNRIETRFQDFMSGLRTLDRNDGETMSDDIQIWRKEQLKTIPNQPPTRNSESQPGVDPMERLKEGETAPSWWAITPGYGGYYREQAFSQWDDNKKAWVEKDYTFQEVTLDSPHNEEEGSNVDLLTINSTIMRGMWINIPIPYTHRIQEVKAQGHEYTLQKDHNGDIMINVLSNKDASQTVTVSIILERDEKKKFTTIQKERVIIPNIPSTLSGETEAMLQTVSSQNISTVEKARNIAQYVRSRIEYLSPKDAQESAYFNNQYRTHKNGFAGAVDELKKGDCDVVNTYFAALCARIGIPVRHCVGHMVQGRDKNNTSHITSGTGHAWSEVWDEDKEIWVRIDATPPGDPQQEEQQDESQERAPGDYGEKVPPRFEDLKKIEKTFKPLTDEQLAKLREKLTEHVELLSYTFQERKMAESTGIELKEARRIIQEINKAEESTLPNGERIIDVLSQLFNMIVESRKSIQDTYDGPVRKRDGGVRIQSLVRHKIGIIAHDPDPASREREATEQQEEKLFGGFDLYFIGDKSGSMQLTIYGKTLWEMQRQSVYLILSALHRFNETIKRASLTGKNNLSVRSEAVSFRGESPEDLDVDKKLYGEFSDVDKVTLWHSMGSAGGGNGDSMALDYVRQQIEEDIKSNEANKNDRLRIVIACSDGGYVGDEQRIQAVTRGLHDLGAVVVGIGLTQSAQSVPEVMNNPPYSKGDIALSVEDLPKIVTKHIVAEIMKLFPQKTKEGMQGKIDSILAKLQ